MGEISKAVGQWVLDNVGWSIVIFLFVLSCFFKLVKVEVDPLGWVIGWLGKAFTKDVRKDIASFKTETHTKFEEMKSDVTTKITGLQEDYNEKIADLRADLDMFEMNTGKNGTLLKQRLDEMEKSNDMQTVRQIKAHVLNFANSCMNGVKHTVKDFRNIIKENKEYEELVAKYDLVNDVYTDDFAYIMEVYHNCKKNRSFLMDNGQPYEEDDE